MEEEKVMQRKVTLTREADGIYIADNGRGGKIRFGHNAEDGFGAVELLLAAVLGCSSTDVDMMTTRRAEPDHFEVTGVVDKVTGGVDGAHLRDIHLTFDLRFPEGDDGDKARDRIASALEYAHETSCTVSRSLERGTKVTLAQA
jgi:putative redox protein